MIKTVFSGLFVESFWRGELSGSLWIVSGEFSRNYPCFPGERREDRLSANVRRVQLSADKYSLTALERGNLNIKYLMKKKPYKVSLW